MRRQISRPTLAERTIFEWTISTAGRPANAWGRPSKRAHDAVRLGPAERLHQRLDRRSGHAIEVRKPKGQRYSTLKGFFRQYELIYVVADERDVIRLRTNYRRNPPEDVHVNWKILASGYVPEYLYEEGRLEDMGLSFTELQRRAYVNVRAQAADSAADFSRRIRTWGE